MGFNGLFCTSCEVGDWVPRIYLHKFFILKRILDSCLTRRTFFSRVLIYFRMGQT